MSSAAVVVVITRPRPQQNAQGGDDGETTVSILYDENDSDSDILRKAADQLDAGPTLPPVS